MIARVTIAIAFAVAVCGCSLGFGTPYPGAATRYREFYRCSSVSGSWCNDPYKSSETAGGGAHGIVAGMRMGVESGDLGTSSAGGISVEARAEYSYAVARWLALGAFASGQIVAGNVDEGDVDFAVRRTPVGAAVTLVPTPPLIVRAGALVAPGTIRIGDDLESSSMSRGFFAGTGMSIPFPGLHMVLTFEWQRHRSSDVMTASGTATYTADTYMFGYWLVL